MGIKSELDVTNRFMLDFAARFSTEHPGAKILEFGCGTGRVVVAGRNTGLDISGVDVFYGGSRAAEEAEQSELFGSRIKQITDGHTGYPDGCFDLVVNNQVLEHVEDLERVLDEIHRILKPGGVVLSIFPSRDVFREGHIGIPFSHWFSKDSATRMYYTWALRSVGLGTWKEQAPTCRQWAIDKLRWLDTYTHYRTREEIFGAFRRRFRSELREQDYIRYRLLDRPGRQALARLLDFPLVPSVACAVFRKLAFLVLVSRKEAL